MNNNELVDNFKELENLSDSIVDKFGFFYFRSLKKELFYRKGMEAFQVLLAKMNQRYNQTNDSVLAEEMLIFFSTEIKYFNSKEAKRFRFDYLGKNEKCRDIFVERPKHEAPLMHIHYMNTDNETFSVA